MEKIENENGEMMWVYDNFIDNQMKINICNLIFDEYSEVRNMPENHEYWEIPFIELLLMDYDYFFENIKDKMHIYVPEEETRNFEEEIIYWLKYWFRDRTVREHYFVFNP